MFNDVAAALPVRQKESKPGRQLFYPAKKTANTRRQLFSPANKNANTQRQLDLPPLQHRKQVVAALPSAKKNVFGRLAALPNLQ